MKVNNRETNQIGERVRMGLEQAPTSAMNRFFRSCPRCRHLRNLNWPKTTTLPSIGITSRNPILRNTLAVIAGFVVGSMANLGLVETGNLVVALPVLKT